MLSGSSLSLPLSELVEALKRNNLEKVKQVIKNEPVLANANYRSCPVLVIAIDQKFDHVEDMVKLSANYEIIKFLVQNKADLDIARQYAEKQNNEHVLKKVKHYQKKMKHFINPPPIVNQYQNNIRSTNEASRVAGHEPSAVASKGNIFSKLFKRK